MLLKIQKEKKKKNSVIKKPKKIKRKNSKNKTK